MKYPDELKREALNLAAKPGMTVAQVERDLGITPGLIGAIHLMIIMSSCPLQWQAEAPTRDMADRFLAERIQAFRSCLDANDMLYQVGASEDYDPAPGLSNIRAPLLAINFADDQVNPPELGILEAGIREVPRGRHILLPIDEHTRGHGTHTLAGVWKQHLAEFLEN